MLVYYTLTSFRKSILSRHSIPSSAVILNSCSISGSLCCNCTRRVARPIILTAHFAHFPVSPFFCMWTSSKAIYYLHRLLIQRICFHEVQFLHLNILLYLLNTLITLQFSACFFLKGWFHFKCWELPQETISTISRCVLLVHRLCT